MFNRRSFFSLFLKQNFFLSLWEFHSVYPSSVHLLVPPYSPLTPAEPPQKKIFKNQTKTKQRKQTNTYKNKTKQNLFNSPSFPPLQHLVTLATVLHQANVITMSNDETNGSGSGFLVSGTLLSLDPHQNSSMTLPYPGIMVEGRKI